MDERVWGRTLFSPQTLLVPTLAPCSFRDFKRETDCKHFNDNNYNFLYTEYIVLNTLCSKMSELESNPPDEEKKAINSFYDATSYNLNGDYFDNQVINQYF